MAVCRRSWCSPTARASAGRAGDDTAAPVVEPNVELARPFRGWLMRAGVNRTELHEATPTRKAMTFYDLRATGITWLAVAGLEPLRIMQRAGHTNFGTTMIYVRLAEELRRDFGAPFAPLPAAIVAAKPDMREIASRAAEFRTQSFAHTAATSRDLAETHRNRTCPGQPNCPTSVLKTEGGTSRPSASGTECSR